MNEQKPPYLRLVTEVVSESINPPVQEAPQEEANLPDKVYEALIEALVATTNPSSVFHHANKILIIGLRDEGDDYQYSVIQGGEFQAADMVALLEMVKSKILFEINKTF